jgi:multidrug efflux pump subunit AcrA (membrane-fusion protein)
MSHVISTRRVKQVNPRVRTLHFVALLENSDGLLADGMSVDGWIAVTGETESDSVPKDAVTRIDGQPFVYRIEGGKQRMTAQRVPVQILFETPERIAIKAIGLKPGDQVIVEGNERLLPGQQVVVADTRKSPNSFVAGQ